MDTYLRRKKDMLFRNVQSLQTVNDLLNDIDTKLGLPHKDVSFSKTPEVLAAIFGVGSGIAVSCLCLYVSGSVLGLSPEGIASALKAAGAIVGGNDTVGMFMIMLPIIILGGIGFHRARLYRDLRLKESKIYFYKRALAKQALLKNALFKTQNANAEIAANTKTSTDVEASSDTKTTNDVEAIAKEQAENLSNLKLLYSAIQKVIRDIKHDLGIV